ncbi:arsenic resistance N-acetyltransferase ArsN2 [Corallococcus coralloides]|uniref:arsenic resistance N-acetyltransferase ArsN2 n=2 Tax=Cystobacterineae TaxID=80811 RepID=UPI00384AFB94|nr:arsenic resistance N-acetyltransferase ArsN2 [Corallococcus sp. AS-1-12]MBZ4400610.1 arsenic resistance N-acetyltransferase ArsN2 [Myxococcus sp. AS-1-15]
MMPTLRPARPADLGAVEALLAGADLPRQGVADHLPYFLVAESEGTLVAAAGLELYGTCALLRSVVVNENQKGKGVGAELVQRLVERAGADGLEALFLLTTTAADYFPRFGFVRIDRAALPPELHASEELRGACPASAVVMCRVMGRQPSPFVSGK